MPLAIASILEDRYRIERLLGQGGMGAVYCAHDIRLQKAVAIKENTMAGPGTLPKAVEASQRQFEREALVLAHLRHPNLPNVTDHFVTPEGNQYLVMDYIGGENLAQIIARTRPVPEVDAVAWISQVCSALEYLHTRQPPVIHRDIKPQNIKVTPEGQVFLVDFGIAKVGGTDSKTTTGAVGVTPGYSPPEQYAMVGTDARSDIYALGATFYELLTGQAPPESVLLEFGEKKLVPPRQINKAVSPAVQRAVLKALAPRRTDRPQTAAEFQRMLTAKGAKREAKSAERAEPPKTRLMGVADEKAAPRKRIPAPQKPPIDRAADEAAGKRILNLAKVLKPLQGSRLLVGTGVMALVALVVAVVLISQTPAVVPVPPAQRPTVAFTVDAIPVSLATLPTNTPVPLTPTTPPTNTPLPPTPTMQPTATPGLGVTRVSEKDGMVMVYVPTGEFLMGSADSDKAAQSDEKPQHTVYVDAFWIDRTEVTNAQYKKCAQAGACKASGYAGDSKYNGDDQPAVGVDWNRAQACCQWAGRQLPTEAQWEKAARGAQADGRIYPWGNQPATCEYAVMKDGSGSGCGKDAPWPVGGKPKGVSPYGALDMAGNVWEWVADWYDEKYYANSPSRNPIGPSSGQYRVLRGGSFVYDAQNVRGAYRGGNLPGHWYWNLGFRCVCASGSIDL